MDQLVDKLAAPVHALRYHAEQEGPDRERARSALSALTDEGAVESLLSPGSPPEDVQEGLRITDKGIALTLTLGGVSDTTLRRMALFAWNRIAWDGDLSRAAFKHAQTIPDVTEDDRYAYVALAEWAQAGYLHLETTHKFAAALMCTRLTSEDVDEAIDTTPGSVIYVRVPDGIIAGDDGARINRAFAMFSKDRDGLRGAHLWAWESGALATQPLAAQASVTTWCTDTSAKRESLLFRLVIGLALTMKHTADFRERHVQARQHGNGRERGDPAHRVYLVGRPIKVDCRPALRDYVAGDRRAPPSVQTVVRGHYKRQVVGVGRGGRKVIWVQPYWRGPEDAPILVRPYAIEGGRQ